MAKPRTILVAVLVAWWCGVAAAQSTLGTPATKGDQLMYVYDASGPRAAFLNVANASNAPVDIEMVFYPTSGDRRELVFFLEAWANRVVDPSEVPGVGGSRGMAVVTPVASPSDRRPVVPVAPLAGNFTQANTRGGAAFGGNAIGRFAVRANGQRPVPGTTVDGAGVSYQRLAPPALAVPAYYAPNSLDPPAEDGNRLVLVSFDDSYSGRYEALSPSGSLLWSMYDASGDEVARGSLSASMVVVTSLQELAAGAGANSSGKVFVRYDGVGGNVFGLFQQSLAAFGAGARLPAVDSLPGG